MEDQLPRTLLQFELQLFKLPSFILSLEPRALVTMPVPRPLIPGLRRAILPSIWIRSVLYLTGDLIFPRATIAIVNAAAE